MRNSKRVQVIQSSRKLVRQLARTLFTHRKSSFFEIVKEITATQVFHYNVDVVLVFKDIEQPDDMGMLAHLEDLNLTPL